MIICGAFFLEIEKSERKPDNTVTMDINGTKYIIDEFFDGKETINNIIAKRIKRELDGVPKGESGLIPCFPGKSEV